MASKMINCQTCGYEEPCKEIVIYCSQCEIVMVHRYCMDGPLRYDVEEWSCEECCPRLLEWEEALMENQYLKEIEDQNLNKDVYYERLQNENSQEVGRIVNQVGGAMECILQSTDKTSDDFCSRIVDHYCMKSHHLKVHEYKKLKEDECFEMSQNNDAHEVDDRKVERVRRPVECALPSMNETSKECCPKTCENEEACMVGQPLKDNEVQNLKEKLCCEMMQNEESQVIDGEAKQMGGPIECVLHSKNETFKECRPKTSGNEEKCMEGQSLRDNEAQNLEEDVYCEMMPNEDSQEIDGEAKQMGDLTKCALESTKETIVDDRHHLKQTSYDVFPRPIYYQIWSRGNFMIHHDMHESVSFQLVAHLCDTASSKVADAAETLPKTLDLKTVPKCSNLPKSYTMSAPTGGDIGLYFFPTNDSDEKQCSSLVEKMIDGELILKFTRSDLNLLVFTSWDLPKELWTTPSSSFSTKTRSATDGKCGSIKNSCSRNIPRCIVQSLPACPSSNPMKFQRGGRVDRAERCHHPRQNGRKNNKKRWHRMLRKTPMKIPARSCNPFQSKLQSKWKNLRTSRDARLYPKPIKRNWNG